MKSVTQKTGLFPEWLGDIDTAALLQNLTNTNPGHIEYKDLRERIGRTKSNEELLMALQPTPAKLVRIVLEAKGGAR